MADNIANNNVTKLNNGLQAGNLTDINEDTSIDDIANAYTDTGHQISEIAQNAYHDVFNRQTKRVGNNFGESPYNYASYYQPAATDAQSALRVAGTQHALETGMERAKTAAEQKLAAAQNNYSNAQSTLAELQQAQQNIQTVNTGEIGGGTSAQELLKFAEASGAENADELNRDVAAKYLSDELVGSTDNWNIREYRDQAKADTLAKFGISEEQYNNFSQEEHDKFWARGDVGSYWTNRYAYTFSKQQYGQAAADEYQKAYDWNYSVIKGVFDDIKAGADSIQDTLSYIMTVSVDKGSDVFNDGTYQAPSIVSNLVTFEGETYNFSHEGQTAYDKNMERTKERSIYNFVSAEDGQEIKELYDKYSSYDQPIIGFDQGAYDDHMKVKTELETKIADALHNSTTHSQKATERYKVSFKADTSLVNNLIEDAFGADIQSVNYLMNMKANNLQQYEDLINDYSLVLTYGQVFEVADGKKTYHTAEGDKVLEAGTYVMYTLPGFQDANGEYLEPNLKKMMQLRSGEYDATMDQDELDEEMQKAMEGYQKVVTAALFLAAGADCDVNESIVHSAIYASSPTNSTAKTGTIYGGHTVQDVIDKFSELANNDGEKAYTLFTKIINKASSVSGSLMANYGGQITTTSNKDEVGRNMVGSELTGSKDANTLFDEGDIDNLTVEEANALWTVIGTSIDQYNQGSTDSNIKSDFLTADGINWFNKTGIGIIKGITSIVDLVANTVWSGLLISGTFLRNGITEGRWGDFNESELNTIFQSPRWGAGGITGNWTGSTDLYSQFVGEYKESAFGYGESNQERMTNNLTHLVTPILEDAWFGDDNTKAQDPMGVGRTGDEGFNYRTIMNVTSDIAGLVGSAVAQNYIAKGVSATATALSKATKKVSAKLAAKVSSKFSVNALKTSSQVANDLMNGAKAAANSPVDDAISAVINKSDDIATQVGEAPVNVLSKTAGDKADDALATIKKNATSSKTAVTGAVEATNKERITKEILEAFEASADDATKAVGTIATSLTSSSMDDLANSIITYSDDVIKAITGVSDDALNEVVGLFAKTTTKNAFNIAHVHAYTGLSIEDLSQLDSSTLTMVSNMVHAYTGGASSTPAEVVSYLRSLSDDTFKSQISDLVQRVVIRNNAGKAWGMDETIRFLARNGWDSKRINLMVNDWLKDQLQDLSTDILYGYTRPVVTNEGTDRETIDEYLTNPMNYVMNAGAGALQYFGGRWVNKMAQAVTSKQLDNANRALAIAESAGNTEAAAKKAKKVLGLVERANSLADQALERGKTLAEIKDLTDKSNSYADDAMRVLWEKSIREMSDADFYANIKDIPGLSATLNDADLGFTKNLFVGYLCGTVKGNANYFQFKKMLGTYDKGLGSIVDVQTNGNIWMSLFDGRKKILNEMNIERGSVTLAQQKKIYKAMVDNVMEQSWAKTIPGLRNSLNNYFDTLLDAARSGKYDKMRAGYLPIESMLNTNADVSAGIRGFSSGEFVLHSSTANPYLERSNLKDIDIVEAILDGETEIKLKDELGNYIVDEAGQYVTRELYAPGLNFLDSITNANNAKNFHDYIDPIIGSNGSQVGIQALKTGQIIVNAPGAMERAMKNTVSRTRKNMARIEEEVLGKANNAKAKADATKATQAKTKQITDQNPDIKNATAQNVVTKKTAEDKIAELTTKKTALTARQREFPATVMGFVSNEGEIDTQAGFHVYNRYKQIVSNDLKAYRNGEITVGSVMSTPMYRYDKFAWQYGRDTFFGQKVDGYNHNVGADATYVALLQDCVANNTEPSKDMIMRRMLMTQEVDPVDSSGNIWSSYSQKTNKTYEWQSPLQYYRSSGITGDATSNMAVRNFQSRENGFVYKSSEKGKLWDASKFDSLMLDTSENINTAKDIIAQNLAGKTLPTTKDGKLNASANKMLNTVTNDIITRYKGNGTPLSFGEYVDELSIRMPEVSLYMGAFDKNSGYYDIFKKLNSLENTGVGFEQFDEYLLSKLVAAHNNNEDITDLVMAWATWDNIRKNSTRAVGLGDNFDVGRYDDGAEGFLLNSSSYAVESNASRTPEEMLESKDSKLATGEEGITGRTINNGEVKNITDIVGGIAETPESLKNGLTKLTNEIDLYMAGDSFSQAYQTRKNILEKLGGTSKNNKGLIDGKVNDLIARAGKNNEAVQARIDDYARARQHRQKAYGIDAKADSTYDPLKAFGATNMGSGYSLTKNPSQFRAAAANLNAYAENVNKLNPLKQELDEAINGYRKAIAAETKARTQLDYFTEQGVDTTKAKANFDKAHSAKLMAQGTADEARKRFAETLKEFGIDLTGGFEHRADTSGRFIDYNKMMLEGGTAEGKINQSISALEEVKTLVSAATDASSLSFLEEVDATIKELETVKQSLPDYMRIAKQKDLQASSADSMEMSLTFLMNQTIYGDGLEQASKYRILPDGTREIYDAKPTNGMFTDEQLNSIGTNSRARGISRSRLELDENGKIIYSQFGDDYAKTSVDFGNHKGVEVEVTADLGDERMQLSLRGDNEYLDISSLSPEEVIELNLNAFEKKGSSYRLGIVEESGEQIEKLTEGERELLISEDSIESENETYGKYTLVKTVSNEEPGVELRNEDKALGTNDFTIDRKYNRDAAYTEWLAFSKDEDAIQNKIERETAKAKKAVAKADKDQAKVENTKVADPDDSTKTTTIKEVMADDAFERRLKEHATPEQYAEWKRNKDLQYDTLRKIGKDDVTVYRDGKGIIYIKDGNNGLAKYSSYENQLKSRGWKPLTTKEEVPEVDPKADKKARKEMQKAITKNRHAGDVISSRTQDWQVPKDKKGNIIFDAGTKKSTIANMEEVYRQVREATGMDLSRDGILMNNEYADLLTRITDESVTAGKFRNMVSAVSNFSQAVQNIQLAGGASFVNALTIAQLRDAIYQNPRAMKEYIKVVGSMRNSQAVASFAQDCMPRLSEFVLETGDASILNDFGAAISTRPGVSDGGVLQNMVTNGLNLRKDFIDARIQNDGSIPKALKDIVSKDIQNTIFEDATFKNAMPVLRAKMLMSNYDAAINQLKKKFPNMDAKLMNKAAIKMSYGKTQAFFDPYSTFTKKTSQVLDETFSKNMRDFAATFTNSKSQETILDTLTGFFFALRYKMMLSGRAAASGQSIPMQVASSIKGRAIKEATEDTFDDIIDTVGTSFMHSGGTAELGSLATMAVIAAASAKALGIPTAWDDASWIDEYDGSFKVPDVLMKFQTIGQIWLPNAYSEERGLYVDPTKASFGLDTMSSIYTLQNSIARTFDRAVNPETYYAAPQRGLIGSASSQDAINQVLNNQVVRAVSDELIGSNLLSPFKAMHEVVMDSTYFGNNIWEKRKLPDGSDNPNYDFGRNVAASVMHILGLDQVLDGGKGYNSWVKGKGTAGYREQDQIGTVSGSGILQHEFLTAAIDMMNGDYLEAIYGAGELPIKSQNLSSKARTEFNTRVKNIIAGYNEEYKAITSDAASTNEEKDAAYKSYVKKAADAVSTWSAKYDYVLGEDQSLVPYVTRTLMAMISGEYDDDMYYVQDAYWKASKEAQIEGGTASNWWLSDDDLNEWIANGGTAESFAEEKQKRTDAYNKALDDEYDARQALAEAGYPEEYLEKYSYNDLKAKQRAVNEEVFTSIHSKLDSKVGEFDNFKEMKAYYESMIDGATTTSKKTEIAMKYNTYVFDLVAPYAEKYGANIVIDGYYQGEGLANDLAEYIILPADKKYSGKNPRANYIKDVFNVGYRSGNSLPSDAEIYDKFIVAQNLMMKGSVSSSISVLDNILDKIKKGQSHVSDRDYNRIINMRSILSARSK